MRESAGEDSLARQGEQGSVAGVGEGEGAVLALLGGL